MVKDYLFGSAHLPGLLAPNRLSFSEVTGPSCTKFSKHMGQSSTLEGFVFDFRYVDSYPEGTWRRLGSKVLIRRIKLGEVGKKCLGVIFNYNLGENTRVVP